jgi:hypothetical protein
MIAHLKAPPVTPPVMVYTALPAFIGNAILLPKETVPFSSNIIVAVDKKF